MTAPEWRDCAGAVVSLAVVTAWCGHGLRLAVREWRACVCGCDGEGEA